MPVGSNRIGDRPGRSAAGPGGGPGASRSRGLTRGQAAGTPPPRVLTCSAHLSGVRRDRTGSGQGKRMWTSKGTKHGHAAEG